MTRLFLAAALLAAVPTFAARSNRAQGLCRGRDRHLAHPRCRRPRTISSTCRDTARSQAKRRPITTPNSPAARRSGSRPGDGASARRGISPARQLDTARVVGELDGVTLQRRDHRRSAGGRFRDLARQQRERVRGQCVLQFRARPTQSFRPYFGVGLGAAVFDEGLDRIRGDGDRGRAVHARAPLLCRRTLPTDPHRGTGKRCSASNSARSRYHTFSLLLGFYFGG